MNSIQRVLAALTFGRAQYGVPDRVPVFPVPLMQGALVYNCTVREYFEMPAEKIAAAQIALNEMFHGVPDAVAGIPNVIEDVTGFGVALEYPYPNSTPAAARMLLREFAEIDGLRCPNPEHSAQLRKTRETISLLSSRIGSEKIVLGAAIAPFSLPSMLMGTSKWMRLLYTRSLREAYLDRLLAICQEFVVKWANVQLAAGAHCVVLADGMASSTIIPRAIFERYAVPLLRDTIQQIKGFVAYEPVGRIEPAIEACAELGAVAILIGSEDDIATCKQRLRGKSALIGNVNNMRMRRWSAARIETQARTAIRQGASGYGFILANQGPEIPFDVSPAVIGALIDAADKYGHYANEGGQLAAH